MLCEMPTSTQTELALMGFSQALPSSLDLPNFEVRECRGETVQNRTLWPGNLGSWESENLGVGESGNLGIWKSTDIKMKIIRLKIRPAQNVCRVLISSNKKHRDNFCLFGQYFHG